MKQHPHAHPLNCTKHMTHTHTHTQQETLSDTHIPATPSNCTKNSVSSLRAASPSPCRPRAPSNASTSSMKMILGDSSEATCMQCTTMDVTISIHANTQVAAELCLLACMCYGCNMKAFLQGHRSAACCPHYTNLLVHPCSCLDV